MTAAGTEFSPDAAVAAVSSELNGILTLKEEQQTDMKAFLKHVVLATAASHWTITRDYCGPDRQPSAGQTGSTELMIGLFQMSKTVQVSPPLSKRFL